MAKVTAEIEVTSDTQGVKQVKAAFDDLSRGGVLGIEKLEDRVMTLQKTMVGVRKELDANRQAQAALNAQITAAGGATAQQTAQLKALEAQEQKIQASLKLSQSSYRTTRQELANLNAFQKDAAGDAMNLISIFGGALPASATLLITRLGAVQAAVGAALPVALVSAGAAAIIGAFSYMYVNMDKIVSKAAELRWALSSWGNWSDFTREAVGNLTGELDVRNDRTKNAAASYERAVAAQKEAALAGLSGPARNNAQLKWDLAHPPAGGRDAMEAAALGAANSAANAALFREYRIEVDAFVRDTNRLFLGSIAAIGQAAEDQIAELIDKAVGTGKAVDTRQIASIRARASLQTNAATSSIWDQVAAARQAADLANTGVLGRPGAQSAADQAKFELTLAGFPNAADADAARAAYRVAREAQAEKERQQIIRASNEQIQGLEDAAEVARTDTWFRGIKQVEVEERAALRRYEDMLDEGQITFEQYERARVAITQTAEAKRIDAIKDFGRTLESLYDRTIGSAKSFGEAMKNIWKEVMDYWKRSAFDALAAILLGQPGATGGVGGPAGAPGGQRQGGGILGGILGGIFGGWGSGGGGNGTTEGNGGSNLLGFLGAGGFGGLSLVPGLGSWGGSAGGGGGVGGGGGSMPNPGQMPWQIPGLGRIATMLKGPLGLGLMAGTMLLGGISSRNRAWAGISGGLGGMMIGATMGALFPTLLGAFGGPIGLAIGALLGFSGLFSGRGKQKQQASSIADQGFAQIRQIFEEYKAFRITYGEATAQMNQVWVSMVQGWQQIGGSVGANSIKDQSKYYQQYLDQMKQIEQARQSRQATGLALPEFASGGYTGNSVGLVHPKEFVMNAAAVRRIGLSALQRANSGGGSDDGSDVEISQVRPRDIVKLLKLDPVALSEGVMVMLRARTPAAKVLL